MTVVPHKIWSESDQQAIREQLGRILQSGPFLNSRRRQRFLEYIVSQTLAGRGERLKGYTVALEVFGRPPSFDPAVDPIVRIEAARLREKLSEYYEAAGRNDPVRIDLPKGGYRPRVEFRDASALDCPTYHNDASSEDEAPVIAPPKERPSIAVLPFVNMSKDQTHDYLSDGITENIITGLSRFRDLLVIASHSTFAYKGKPKKIQDVCRDLGVRFALEGSVQKSGDRATITSQLIDGNTGTHLWAERFDRDSGDIISVLDEVTEKIVSRLATAYGGRLHKAWRGRGDRGSPQNFQAYDYLQRGLHALDLFTPKESAEAQDCFLKAIELDPAYAKPYAKIAWKHLNDVWLGWTSDPTASMAEALRFATLAIARDDDEAWGHWALGGYYLMSGQHERAISDYQRALELNPNDADVMVDFGCCLSYAGRAQQSVELISKAMQTNPYYPAFWLVLVGPIFFDARRYEDAVETLEQSIDTILAQLYLAASYTALGNMPQAQLAVARVLDFDRSASISSLAPVTLDLYRRADDREHLRVNLLKAGLPE